MRKSCFFAQISGGYGANCTDGWQGRSCLAKRMECVELAPAVGCVARFESGSKLHALHTLRAVWFRLCRPGDPARRDALPSVLIEALPSWRGTEPRRRRSWGQAAGVPHTLGDVFDAEGRHRSLQQTVSVFLDEDAIADATVKVTGGCDEDEVSAQRLLFGGEFLRQRQQYRQPRSIFHRRGKRRVVMTRNDDPLVLRAGTATGSRNDSHDVVRVHELIFPGANQPQVFHGLS